MKTHGGDYFGAVLENDTSHSIKSEHPSKGFCPLKRIINIRGGEICMCMDTHMLVHACM